MEKLVRLNKTENSKKYKKFIWDNFYKRWKIIYSWYYWKWKTENLQFYTQFRNIVLNVSSSIKGNIKPRRHEYVGGESLSRFFLCLWGHLYLHLQKERFQGINYNQVTGEITVGRYRALFKI